MPRRFEIDGDDASRLPDGMTRVGYDADTQVYTFRDAADGSLWEGPAGCEYGQLTRVATAPKLPSIETSDVEGGEAPPSYDESEAQRVPFLASLEEQQQHQQQQQGGRWAMARHWRSELMPLLNFFMILALFLIGLFWFLGWMTSSHNSLSTCGSGAHAHKIQKGESCWSIAQLHEIEVDQLRQANLGIDCNLLRAGGLMCVPAVPKV
ncbi:unnamed protein product [Discula destructiva]